MRTQSGLNPQFNTYDRQKCFIAYTHRAPWSEDILAACIDVLPRFGLEAWYADDQFEPSRSLKEKVVEMIANARYGIFDLSALYNRGCNEWTMPRNVLIELGIAIALNRPVLLLRTAENRIRGHKLPVCLSGIGDIIEFSGELTLKRALDDRLPQWLNVAPDQMWWARNCLFGHRVCEYREIYPSMERWRRKGLHCHLADGADTDRVDFRGIIQDEINRYNNLTLSYLNDCLPTKGYQFVQCAHCQTVRTSQFAIYRITPQTDAETYIAIGMTIALETQFGYDIPKIFFVADVHEVPSLLSGYEVIEAANTKIRRQRLRKALPVVMQSVQECAWNPRPLPFEMTPPIVQSPFTHKEGEALEVEHPVPSSEPVVFHEQLRNERQRLGLTQEMLAQQIDCDTKTIGRWENGQGLPRPYYREKLCKIFGKSPQELGLTQALLKSSFDPILNTSDDSPSSLIAQQPEDPTETQLLQEYRRDLEQLRALVLSKRDQRKIPLKSLDEMERGLSLIIKGLDRLRKNPSIDARFLAQAQKSVIKARQSLLEASDLLEDADKPRSSEESEMLFDAYKQFSDFLLEAIGYLDV